MSLTPAIKANIQGDVWPGLPKRFQSFLFFRIRNKVDFKSRLKTFIPKITTAQQACQMNEIIKQAREEAARSKRSAKLQALPGINISFTSTGLEALGAFVNVNDQGLVKKDRKLSQVFRNQQLRGGLFEKGMYADLVGEGWDNPQELRKEYHPTSDNQRLIDGVIMVTSSVRSELDAKVSEVKQHFLAEEGEPLNPDTYVISKDPSIELTLVRDGKVRPGDKKGKEHFGFKDGISQPIIEGWDEKQPTGKEPKATKPGLILCGYEGDDMSQPKWAKDGSFLVFRDLQQLVPEFEEFMEENAQHAPFTQDHPKPGEKLAAYLMGRWKNGTPVDESPHDDSDESLHSSNNFDYHPVNEHKKCPFAAHTRKMRPRADLDHDHAVIIRRGIPYGEEVTAEEAAERKSAQDKERGLLFVCYQSDIRNGFNFLTTRWASNHHFPDRKSNFVGGEGPGIDAIVGQRLDHHPPRSIGLPDGKFPTEARMPLESWVIQKGGEYFFAPSLSALENELTGPGIFDQEALERLREEDE
ncbi:Dyp-type peroxidase [Penicillium soppii]|uniref:Dyp-type peroxidase n=1 Tax=Penicillium soppii TaxID=69789 RepID=UPI002548F772|nr:Dyp-type peroxidase [Penicillium soppii]KAJ5872484.1 Dyp-type peroxidase [Penicillium soppii]